MTSVPALVPDSDLRPDPTLGEWLAARARTAPPRRLLLDVAGGGLVVAISVLWRPAAWPALVGVGLCVAAFRVWALAERRLAVADARVGGLPGGFPRSGSGSRGGTLSWRALRTVAAIVGVLAAGLALFEVVFGALGRWIS